MIYQEIVEEISRLSLSEKASLVEIILKDIDRESPKDKSLAEAVKLLAKDYANDKDLIVFSI